MLCYKFLPQCYPLLTSSLTLTHKSWVVPLSAPCKSTSHLSYLPTRGRPGGWSLSCPKKHVSIHKWLPVVLTVPPYLSNSVQGSSARTWLLLFPRLCALPGSQWWAGKQSIAFLLQAKRGVIDSFWEKLSKKYM